MDMTAPRLHRPLISAVEQGLTEVLNSGKPADQFLAGIAKNRRFGGRDRRFIAANLYDILRYKRLFDAVAAETRPSGIPLHTYNILLNQVRLFGAAPGAEKLYPSWTGLDSRCHQLLTNPGIDGRISLSYPDWIWEAGLADYGESWPAIAAALNDQAPVYLRVNRLRTTAPALQKALAADGIVTEPTGLPDALVLPGREPLMRHRLYEAGHFEFQDLASQHVAAGSDIRPGMAVADACAGAGGKALHAAALMNNEGVVYASDRFAHRLKQLRFRAERAGATCIDVIDEATMASLKGAVQRLLLDVPCTATGTIWRKPEIKWQATPAMLENLLGTQREILDRYAPIVAPGGLLTYATCSILKAEGEDQAGRFLAGHPEFSLASEQRLLPNTHRTDGFYIAVLRRD